jgi:hypothetical protein
MAVPTAAPAPTRSGLQASPSRRRTVTETYVGIQLEYSRVGERAGPRAASFQLTVGAAVAVADPPVPQRARLPAERLRRPLPRHRSHYICTVIDPHTGSMPTATPKAVLTTASPPTVTPLRHRPSSPEAALTAAPTLKGSSALVQRKPPRPRQWVALNPPVDGMALLLYRTHDATVSCTSDRFFRSPRYTKFLFGTTRVGPGWDSTLHLFTLLVPVRMASAHGLV